jgi:hypothetical protein
VTPGDTTTPTPTPASTGFAGQTQDTFTRLAGDVQAGKLSARDAGALATATGQLGVLGEAEALRAAHLAEALPAAEQQTFQSLLDGASSDTARAFLYKALGAGHTVAEVQTFAGQLGGLTDAQLVDRLSLADDEAVTTPDARQDGVKQQFEASCVATTAQALRGEFDPIYALAVRSQNTDVHDVDDGNAFAKNAAFATEQKQLLEQLGQGNATNRNEQVNARGVMWGSLRAVFDAMSAYTGYTYSPTAYPQNVTDRATTDALCDGLAAQLSQGIATPLLITGDQNFGGHAILATAVDGSGESQRFLIHDPWDGVTEWVSRKQIDDGTFKVAGWNRLRGYMVATPSSAPVTPPEPRA